MTNKKFIKIIIEEVFDYINNTNKERYFDENIEKYGSTFYEAKKIFNSLNEKEKKIFIKILTINTDETISTLLSIIDEWGGGYFDDGKNNDGHFELYYVSNEKGKYKYRVDENTSDLFLEKMEYIHESENKKV